MPIVDVLVVCKTPEQLSAVSAQALADSLGEVLQAAPGRVWVRTHTMGAAAYAENSAPLDGLELPVFVTVMHSHLPEGEALAIEVQAITAAVASALAAQTRVSMCSTSQLVPVARPLVANWSSSTPVKAEHRALSQFFK